MRPHVTRLILATLLLVLCQRVAEQATAKVVRDAKAAAANPGVEAGGQAVPAQPPPQPPYSLIGAIALDDQQIGRCSVEPWRLFSPIAFRHAPLFRARAFRARSGRRTVRILPPIR